MRHFLVFLMLTFAGQALADESRLDVRDFGAIGDGVADDTAAIQKALDQAAETGRIVELTPGQYRCNDQLAVPIGVTLQGVWQGPHTSHLDKGSVLLSYAGRGNENSKPFITLNTSSTLKGVTIFYPEQKVGAITPYPWTVQGKGQHYNVIDTTIANAYNGIDCGTFHNEGHHLRNVHMCALNKGVYIDQTTDVGRVENVHIHNVYWWRVSKPYALTGEEINALNTYTPKHLVGFIIGRTDWQYMSNCFVIWAKIGFHFIKSQRGLANAVITQSGSDIGPLAVKIDAVQNHAGVAFENCQFMSGFEISPDNRGPVKLTNCGFWSIPQTGSQMMLHGDNTVFLTATHFHRWDIVKKGTPCIEMTNGSLIVQGCEFMGEPDSPDHLRLKGKARSAVIMGSRFRHGKAKITNESEAEVQILGNVTQ